MAGPLKASMAEIQMEPGMQLVWEAIDPTTGAAVSGVKVSAIGVYGPNLGGPLAGAEGFGPFMFVPGPGA